RELGARGDDGALHAEVGLADGIRVTLRAGKAGDRLQAAADQLARRAVELRRRCQDLADAPALLELGSERVRLELVAVRLARRHKLLPAAELGRLHELRATTASVDALLG